MSYTNIPSQYIRTELTPANIKLALQSHYGRDSTAPIAGKDWLARYLETDDGCDTNAREDLFQLYFFTLDLSVDFIGREEPIIKVWTWKRIHGKDDWTKFNVDYTVEHEFNFVHYYSKFTDWEVITIYKDEQTILENIQEILYNRAASASTFHDQCE